MQRSMISGAGMTRFGKHRDQDLRSLATQAANAAMADAGVGVADVDLVVFGNAAAGTVSGQEMIRGQVALLPLGLNGTPVLNVENACASSSSALHVAMMAIGSEAARTVLVVGAEQLTHDDRRRTFAAFAGGVDVISMLASGGRSDADVADELTGGGTKSNFMDVYAHEAHAYMAESGATVEDMAAVVVKSRGFARHNANAQFRSPTTIAEVLDGPMIADPLRRSMCSPIGDGAAAVVLTAAGTSRPGGVLVRACALQSGSQAAGPIVARTAQLAYEAAGVGPEDLDVVELHDAAAPAELEYYEALGLCAPAGGPELLRSGRSGPGGSVPVNPSGGLLSRGHPVGATGCAQLVELYWQLRGRAGDRQVPAARIGLAQNAGGSIDGQAAACVVTILETSDRET